MPFGLTNAVPAFQRVMKQFIKRHDFKYVNVYLDNITVGGMDQIYHDENLKALKEAAKKDNFTFNEEKCLYNCTQIKILNEIPHTDQGTNFMSYEFKSWLNSLGVPTSRTTRYNLRGNGQVERYNGINWKTIVLALRVSRLWLTH